VRSNRKLGCMHDDRAVPASKTGNATPYIVVAHANWLTRWPGRRLL